MVIDIDKISMSKLKDALKVMKNRNAVGLDEINLELLRYISTFCHLKFFHVNKYVLAEVISLFMKRNSSD